MIQLAVMNRSTVLPDAEVRKGAHSVHKQIRQHYAPIWGVSAHVDFVGLEDLPRPGSWTIAVLDNSDEANALGYHDLTPEGLPLGKAFAGTDLQIGSPWTVTLSHEALEMLGDPGINLIAPNAEGRLFAYENCDAVEADNLAYDVDGRPVSDFVTPAWFIPGAHGPFDYRKRLRRPFQLAPDGYISYTDTWPPNWQQAYGQILVDSKGTATVGARRALALTRPRVGSRRERRRTPRDEWVPSRP